ncbi:MAG TPA: hypothetical protein VFK80_09750 [Limnochordia bacterium]|nr:hypothetical protein [Limnochordia bacterium]
MASQSPTTTEIEHAITRIRGVIAVKVDRPDGVIESVHVLAGTGRSPKHVVRDIEAVCAAQFSLVLDHRKVSVAQIDLPNPGKSALRRPTLEAVRLERARTRLTVGVTLSDGENTFAGEAAGPPNIENAARLAADATLKAITVYLGGGATALLNDMAAFELAGRKGVAAAVALTLPSGVSERLVGCAFFKGDAVESAVKACLKAVNRRVTHRRLQGAMSA